MAVPLAGPGAEVASGFWGFWEAFFTGSGGRGAGALTGGACACAGTLSWSAGRAAIIWEK
jgi:hypothetical protein